MNIKLYLPIVFFSLIVVFIINLFHISNINSKKIQEFNILRKKSEETYKENILLDSSLCQANTKTQNLESQIRTLEYYADSVKQVLPKKIILEKTIQRVIKDTVYIYTTSYNEIDSTYMFRPTISDISAEIVP